MNISRIEYLQKNLDDFSEDLMTLQMLIQHDINSSLNKIRFIAEKVLALLCERNSVAWGDAEPTIERMIGPLVAKSIIPKQIAIHVRTIQTNSSPGSHYQISPLSIAHVNIARTALIEFLWWFYKQHSCYKPVSEPNFAEEHEMRGEADGFVHSRKIIDAAALRVGDLNDVLNWGWNGIRLLDEFIRIDYETIESLDGESEGHSQQWVPIFMHHPETWRMLLTKDNTIAGYWHFAPLFEEDYQTSAKGKLLDSDITVDRVPYFELPGFYKVHICQVCLLPQYRTISSIKLLLNSVFDVLEMLADEDILISQVSANAYTLAGHALCKTFNMTYRCKHDHVGDIYLGTIAEILNSSFGLRRALLREQYMKKGLL